MQIPITITADAKARLKKMLAFEEGATGMTLSIAQNKGCGGNEYKWGHVKEAPAGHDEVVIEDNFKLYIPMMDSLNLFGTIIDFKEDNIGNARFEFSNPNETGRCGCGESVSFGKQAV